MLHYVPMTRAGHLNARSRGRNNQEGAKTFFESCLRGGHRADKQSPSLKYDVVRDIGDFRSEHHGKLEHQRDPLGKYRAGGAAARV
jgi:hypothetical protein